MKTPYFIKNSLAPSPVPVLSGTGIGARQPHFKELLEKRPSLGFLEVHSENFFAAGGPQINTLEQLRAHYPISLHGIGLSLGSADGLKQEHLIRLKNLVEHIDPFMVSEHLSWSAIGHVHVPDLLPLPLTQEAFDIFSRNIEIAQETLKRPILIENPSAYLAFKDEDMSEPEFLTALVQRTGCLLLLDVNNIYVSATNIGFDSIEYLQSIPSEYVHEIHLAGFHINTVDNQNILIDAHNNKVSDEVWNLYQSALAHFGDRSTLVEWDTDLPDLSVLLSEAQKADNYRRKIEQEDIDVHTV